jgi:hypothetical protein
MEGRGGGDAVFLRQEQMPRRRREPPTPPPSLSGSALLYQGYYYDQRDRQQPPRYLVAGGAQPQRPFKEEHGDAVLVDDSTTPLTAATTSLELTDGEAEGEDSPAPEATPTSPWIKKRRKQTRNKPTLSCFECVERKTKVRIGNVAGHCCCECVLYQWAPACSKV